MQHSHTKEYYTVVKMNVLTLLVNINEKSKMQKYIQHIISRKFNAIQNNYMYCLQMQIYVIEL